METTNELFMFYVIGIGVALLLVLAAVLTYYTMQHKKRKEQFARKQVELESAVASQERLLFNSYQAQEAERERVAKDIHDEVGAKLNMINLYLNRLAPKTADADTRISEMREVLNNTIHTSSRISHDLLPPSLENFGLFAAVEELSDSIQKIHSVSMRVKMDGQRPERVSKGVELNLFRILQELISYSLSNANTGYIYLNLWQNEEKFVIEYRDNAGGLEEKEDTKQQELSLKNIESRLEMIKGTFDLRKKNTTHTQIKMEVRLNPEP